VQMIGANATAHAEVSRMYREAQRDASGNAAVGNAQAVEALKKAANLAAPSAANTFALSGQAGADAKGGQLVAQALQAQASRFVGGRNFYQNGAQWVDANVGKQHNAHKVQIRFGSAEYFDLVSKHPEANQWLALGRNVQVALADTVYDISELTGRPRPDHIAQQA
jgi:hypothetical protein